MWPSRVSKDNNTRVKHPDLFYVTAGIKKKVYGTGLRVAIMLMLMLLAAIQSNRRKRFSYQGPEFISGL
jgi:hypothetical protein